MADHLDDDALNAILDGEARPGSDHARGCEICRARLETLTRAAAAVAAPPPLPGPDRREAAIAAAMEELTAGVGRRGAADGVTSLAEHRRVPRWLLGAAAAIVVAAVAVPLAVTWRGDDGEPVASGLGSDTAASGGAAFGAAGGGGAVGDLGEIGAGTDLRPAIRAALPPEGAPSSRQGADADAEAAQESTADAATAAAPVTCLAEAIDQHGAVGELVVQKTATFDGRKAAVLAFAHDNRLTVQVLAADSCELLTFQTFER